jgi:hypothetical protein
VASIELRFSDIITELNVKVFCPFGVGGDKVSSLLERRILKK